MFWALKSTLTTGAEKYCLSRSAWSRIQQPEGCCGSLLVFYREHFAGELDVLSVDEAAAMVKVMRNTVLKWCTEGRLEVFTVMRAF